MAIPDYETLMLPLLQLTADGTVHRFTEAVESLADEFQLTESERTELLPSGAQPVFRNRVGWAKSYMKQAGLLEFPKRGLFQITSRGQEALKESPNRIDGKFLEQYADFREFKARRRTSDKEPSSSASASSESPEDRMASAFSLYRGELEAELLGLVKEVTPTYFEQIVVDLLVSMGYGGNRQDAGRAVTRQSGDEGIDGVIKQDRLGLDVVYVQAKRWEGKVGRPEIQKFAGALQGKRAVKGVFITTSAFSKEAAEFADSIGTKIILIDGQRLAQLMIEFGVGVSDKGNYEIKQVDSDYFEG